MTISDQELQERLREVIRAGWVPIPDMRGYCGTGAPGKILEELLYVDGGNLDIPDAGKWELKFHSGSALITLFHLEADPSGYLYHLIHEFGWPDKYGRPSFRHTVRGRSPKGFYVENESNRSTVRHDEVSDIVWPYWTHDKILNRFASKLRRLVLVTGEKKKDFVRFNRADFYQEPQTTALIEAIEQGFIAIDFDARTNNGSGLRNHGTKFRIQREFLDLLYHRKEPLV